MVVHPFFAADTHGIRAIKDVRSTQIWARVAMIALCWDRATIPPPTRKNIGEKFSSI
jgi:hypothetical protein